MTIQRISESAIIPELDSRKERIRLLAKEVQPPKGTIGFTYNPRTDLYLKPCLCSPNEYIVAREKKHEFESIYSTPTVEELSKWIEPRFQIIMEEPYELGYWLNKGIHTFDIVFRVYSLVNAISEGQKYGQTHIFHPFFNKSIRITN